ncbi:hypothetical protein, partial [Mesorhizobium sp. M2C.T.Ca.TU.002.02.1.1]|uniref:hypothetical protein n=1 Tax=Mesorhizobium sp. M2C.T.Ca.TU.002.02.1.1 TaxID=2496788 RepID=UPI0019D0021C
MVSFLSVGAIWDGVGFVGTGQEAKRASSPVSLSCLSRQLEAIRPNSGFDFKPPWRPSPRGGSGRQAARLELHQALAD